MYHFLSKDSSFKLAYFFRMGPSPLLLGFFAKQFLRWFQSFKYGKVWVRNEVCRKFKRVFITPLTLLCLVSVLRDGWDHLKFQPHMVKSLGTHHQIGWENFFFAVIKNRDARYDVGKKPEFLCKDKSCPLLDEDVDIIDSMAFPSSFPKCFSKLTSYYQIG